MGVGVEAAVHPDSDLIADGMAVDAMFTAAGAGMGALASARADAPVWGMLGAGTAGLVLGGALHRSIEIDGADAPLLTLATAEGLWLGGWLPTAIHGWGQATSAEQAGGLVAGGAGALGLATLASGALELSPSTAGYTALASGIGASLGGGIALVSPALHDRRGVDLMMGGTAVGIAAGAALAPRLALTPPSVAAGATAVGGMLGVTESLLFAWSARSDGSKSYGGAALIGGGIGATLGLATAAAPEAERSGNVPAAAGFAAWGAWMGSFSGSLVHNDPHDIVLGGLLGADAGFLGGYALLRTGAVDPSDFGWLSLFGALGTVAGAGAGAPFSTRTAPGPVLAGLAIGPAVGMLGGALLLPKLRRLADRPTAAVARLSRTRSSRSAAFASTAAATRIGADATPTTAELGAVPPRETLSSNVIGDLGRPFWRRVGDVVDGAQLSPLVGALPAPTQSGRPPLLFGVTGLWH
jgi:hypothetical protein